MKLTDIPAGYKRVVIAFADMASDGTASFSVQAPAYVALPNADEAFKNDIKLLQSRGVKVLISFGGQNGIYQINDVTQKNKFIATLEDIITKYGFDGVDYDIENGLTNANSHYLVEATKVLKENFAAKGKSLIFTLAPETIDVYWQTFPNGKYDALIQSGLISTVQVQLYNSGCMPGYLPGSSCYSQGTVDFIVSQADSTIQTWLKGGVQNAESLYVAGLPASTSAAGGGYVDPATLKKAATCLASLKECGSYIPTKTYPEFSGFMTWSVNWDASNGYQFEKTVRDLG